MKGVNDLTLCESAMMEALQFWLNAQFIKAAPKVTGISGHQEGYVKTFKVTLEEDADAKN